MAVFFFFFACLIPGGGLILQVLFGIVVGWFRFLVNVKPNVEIVWTDVGFAAVMLSTFVVGLHFFMRWLVSQRQLAWKWTSTISITAVSIVLFVASISMIGLTHQVVWLFNMDEPMTVGGRDLIGRSMSKHNLKVLGLATHNYSDEFHKLPSAILDKNGNPLHGWATALLPYVERRDIHEKIDLSQPWNAPINAAAYKTRLDEFQVLTIRQTEDAPGYSLMHYSANARLINVGSKMRLRDITDGRANTVLMGEIVDELPAWGYPLNWRDPALGINRVPHGFGSSFQGGANLGMADGSVRFTSNQVERAIMKAIATPNGGEVIPEY